MIVARTMRLLAVGVVGLFGLVGALFVAGEGFDDPGGWRGLGLFLIWGVPMATLVALALLRPATAARVLPWALAVAAVVVLVEAGSTMLDRSGPGSAIVMFVVAVPCGLLGLHRAGEAAALVLGAACLQLVAVVAQYVQRSGEEGPSFGDTLGSSTGVIVVPLLLCAGLLLVAALLERVGTRHGGHARALR